MPAFAPLLRPVFVCGLTDLLVAVAAAALGVPGDKEDKEDEVVVGIDVDVDVDEDEDEDEDEDVVAAAIGADHVVAERSDLQQRSQSAYLCVNSTVPRTQDLVSVGGKV